jgi:hypothetical protein
MNERRVADALSDCLDRIAAGEPLEACVARYPDIAQELRPLLTTAQRTSLIASAIAPSQATRNAVLARVMADWPTDKPRKTAFFGAWLMRPAVAVTAAVLALLAVGGVGTVSAASGSVPGDLLYPVKTTREKVSLLLARS